MIYIIILLGTNLFLTDILEIVPVAFLGRKKKWLGASLICNLITNPILNTLLILLSPYILKNAIAYPVCAIILEIAVIIAEAFLYRLFTGDSLGKCFLVSVISNLISFLIGIGFFYLLESPPYVEPYRPWMDNLV